MLTQKLLLLRSILMASFSLVCVCASPSLSHQWLIESKKAKFFIHEPTNGWGLTFSSEPFRDRTFVLTAEFSSLRKRDRVELGQKLIRIGGGTILPLNAASLSTADYVLVARLPADAAAMGVSPAARVIDWDSFMQLIPGYAKSRKPRASAAAAAHAAQSAAAVLPLSTSSPTSRSRSPSESDKSVASAGGSTNTASNYKEPSAASSTSDTKQFSSKNK